MQHLHKIDAKFGRFRMTLTDLFFPPAPPLDSHLVFDGNTSIITGCTGMHRPEMWNVVNLIFGINRNHFGDPFSVHLVLIMKSGEDGGDFHLTRTWANSVDAFTRQNTATDHLSSAQHLVANVCNVKWTLILLKQHKYCWRFISIITWISHRSELCCRAKRQCSFRVAPPNTRLFPQASHGRNLNL